MKNILFVCTANECRSRTAEVYFQNKYPNLRFRSAGINKYLSERHGGNHIKQYMCEVADRIICMEKVHSDYILNQINISFFTKITVLNLGNTDSFYSESLIELLEKEVTPLLIM